MRRGGSLILDARKHGAAIHYLSVLRTSTEYFLEIYLCIPTHLKHWRLQ